MVRKRITFHISIGFLHIVTLQCDAGRTLDQFLTMQCGEVLRAVVPDYAWKTTDLETGKINTTGFPLEVCTIDEEVKDYFKKGKSSGCKGTPGKVNVSFLNPLNGLFCGYYGLLPFAAYAPMDAAELAEYTAATRRLIKGSDAEVGATAAPVDDDSDEEAPSIVMASSGKGKKKDKSKKGKKKEAPKAVAAPVGTSAKKSDAEIRKSLPILPLASWIKGRLRAWIDCCVQAYSDQLSFVFWIGRPCGIALEELLPATLGQHPSKTSEDIKTSHHPGYDLEGGFDYIDTTLLADVIGLPNLLVSCEPLLSRCPHSALVTQLMQYKTHVPNVDKAVKFAAGVLPAFFPQVYGLWCRVNERVLRAPTRHVRKGGITSDSGYIVGSQIWTRHDPLAVAADAHVLLRQNLAGYQASGYEHLYKQNAKGEGAVVGIDNLLMAWDNFTDYCCWTVVNYVDINLSYAAVTPLTLYLALRNVSIRSPNPKAIFDFLFERACTRQVAFALQLRTLHALLAPTFLRSEAPAEETEGKVLQLTFSKEDGTLRPLPRSWALPKEHPAMRPGQYDLASNIRVILFEFPSVKSAAEQIEKTRNLLWTTQLCLVQSDGDQAMITRAEQYGLGGVNRTFDFDFRGGTQGFAKIKQLCNITPGMMAGMGLPSINVFRDAEAKIHMLDSPSFYTLALSTGDLPAYVCASRWSIPIHSTCFRPLATAIAEGRVVATLVNACNYSQVAEGFVLRPDMLKPLPETFLPQLRQKCRALDVASMARSYVRPSLYSSGGVDIECVLDGKSSYKLDVTITDSSFPVSFAVVARGKRTMSPQTCVIELLPSKQATSAGKILRVRFDIPVNASYITCKVGTKPNQVQLIINKEVSEDSLPRLEPYSEADDEDPSSFIAGAGAPGRSTRSTINMVDTELWPPRLAANRKPVHPDTGLMLASLWAFDEVTTALAVVIQGIHASQGLPEVEQEFRAAVGTIFDLHAVQHRRVFFMGKPEPWTVSSIIPSWQKFDGADLRYHAPLLLLINSIRKAGTNMPMLEVSYVNVTQLQEDLNRRVASGQRVDDVGTAIEAVLAPLMDKQLAERRKTMQALAGRGAAAVEVESEPVVVKELPAPIIDKLTALLAANATRVRCSEWQLSTQYGGIMVPSAILALPRRLNQSNVGEFYAGIEDLNVEFTRMLGPHAARDMTFGGDYN
jgi:hypothetical protein